MQAIIVFYAFGIITFLPLIFIGLDSLSLLDYPLYFYIEIHNFYLSPFLFFVLPISILASLYFLYKKEIVKAKVFFYYPSIVVSEIVVFWVVITYLSEIYSDF